MANVNKVSRKTLVRKALGTKAPAKAARAAQDARKAGGRAKAPPAPKPPQAAPRGRPKAPAPTAPKAVREPGPRQRERIAQAESGTLPQPPDFSANTHKPYRKRLAALVALVEARDLKGLQKVEMLPPRSSSPKALDRYRNLAMIALKAKPSAAGK